MSLSIPQKILDVSSKVSVEIDLDKLGPRQKTSLVKMLRTGHVAGNGVPAQLAVMIRGQLGAETVQITKGWIASNTVKVNAGTDSLKQTLRVALVASKLDPENKIYTDPRYQNHWHSQECRDNDALMMSDDFTEPDYTVHTISKRSLNIVKKHKLSTPQAVLDIANNIETGVTKTFSLNYN